MAISFLRTFILYSLVIIIIRLMGKRQLGELEPSELVVTILISELAAVPMQDPEVPLLYGVVPMVVLLAMEVIIAYGAMKNIKLRSLMCGKPSILIDNGKIIQSALLKTRVNIDEIIEELRLRGITDLNEVQYAILETNGQMSVIQRPYAMPATRQDMGVPPNPGTLPVCIVNDGHLMEENLNYSGHDKAWLEKVLSEHQVMRLKEIFWLSVDRMGTIVFIRKEKKEETP